MKTFKLTELGESRLLKMIQFLKELPEDKFDFSDVVSKYDDENKCGTVCCAIGWTPIIFPNLVHWNPPSDEVCELSMTEGLSYHFSIIAAKLFGLTQTLAEWLFTPFFQPAIHKDLPICEEFSKPSDVASMLEKFIELCHKSKIMIEEGEKVFEPIQDNK